MLIADELARAVELTLNPSISHDSRLQAYNACERLVPLLITQVYKIEVFDTK